MKKVYKLTRNVTKEECHWLDRNFEQGEIVHKFNGATYGCISWNGEACSMDGDIPFFELPDDALEVVNEH